MGPQHLSLMGPHRLNLVGPHRLSILGPHRLSILGPHRLSRKTNWRAAVASPSYRRRRRHHHLHAKQIKNEYTFEYTRIYFGGSSWQSIGFSLHTTKMLIDQQRVPREKNQHYSNLSEMSRSNICRNANVKIFAKSWSKMPRKNGNTKIFGKSSTNIHILIGDNTITFLIQVNSWTSYQCVCADDAVYCRPTRWQWIPASRRLSSVCNKTFRNEDRFSDQFNSNLLIKFLSVITERKETQWL